MKKIVNLILIVVTSFSFVQCSLNEDIDLNKETVSMKFSATIDEEPLTKTVLDGSGTASARDIFWLPLDVIKISTGSAFSKFTYNGSVAAAHADFTGEITPGDVYYAVYPSSNDVAIASGILSLTLPSIQNYKADTFGEGAYPMVAKSSSTSLGFKNLCGAIVLNLKGSATIASIAFEAKDGSSNLMKVAGAATVDMGYSSAPAIAMGATAATKVVLDCGNGVALSSGTATPFYIVLPPATYNTFTLYITTTDSKVMTKTATNLVIDRSKGAVTSDLTFAEDAVADLSAAGNANCYIVSRAGNFSFDATVIGNGAEGLLPEYAQTDKLFHTEDVAIAPLSARLLWQDVEDMITNVAYSGGKVTFTSSAAEGNAVIAVYDNADPTAASAKILWSWHIWCTDKPQTQNYINRKGSTFTVLDRNMGAIASNPGTGTDAEVLATYGVLYQWGRKDPFPGSAAVAANTNKTLYGAVTSIVVSKSNADRGTIAYSIANPARYLYNDSYTDNDWLSAARNNYLWGNPFGYSINYVAKKSIYDPCPSGYMVGTRDMWTRFTTTGDETSTASQLNVNGSFNNGWNFYCTADKSGSTDWYPKCGSRAFDGGTLAFFAGSGWYWSSSSYSGTSANAIGMRLASDKVSPLNGKGRANGQAVRCIQEL